MSKPSEVAPAARYAGATLALITTAVLVLSCLSTAWMVMSPGEFLYHNDGTRTGQIAELRGGLISTRFCVEKERESVCDTQRRVRRSWVSWNRWVWWGRLTLGAGLFNGALLVVLALFGLLGRSHGRWHLRSLVLGFNLLGLVGAILFLVDHPPELRSPLEMGWAATLFFTGCVLALIRVLTPGLNNCQMAKED